MRKRATILLGMAGGAIWAVVLVWAGGFARDVALDRALAVAFFLAGLPLMLMIGRLAQRRFFDDSVIDGQPLSGPAEIDQRVLANTVEQIVLAACFWPLAGWALGGGTVVALGAGFAVARCLFWLGYHMSPPLRSLGFAASFYPTILAAALALIRTVSGSI
ncbi:MAPEG family protein [Thalassococcus sp. CAU 1522]|uniref:MAPEG family protein n=1 Tax=Thalassococcus arenae TaxID=2851652 RepID=A0ABS6N906_9RHOB|nr:MAPEG family protein [Thalassococcus arenae]MBV2360485.1 MAPEG family protein [Thalassococcus arenae]